MPAGSRRPKPGIVHLGLGAFFRAHVATYLADAMAQSGGDWGVIGASLQSPAMRDRLAPQDHVYTAVELGPDGRSYRLMDVVTDVLVAPEDPACLLDVMAAPGIRLVSLTITEKGYCHVPSTGRLQADHPDISHDLAHPQNPRTALGFLVGALERRRRAGQRPFTVLSCDNLPENGQVLRRLVLEFAAARDKALADWIEAEARFPSCMVDRIVPATTKEDIEAVCAATGRRDLAPVMHEPFRQWVVEDDFVDGARPDLAAAGAEMVADVTPFEKMKLRCLNGTHSALAYLGYLAGHATICDAVSDPLFAGLCDTLWRDEIIPTLTPPQGADLAAYARALLARYRNPAIRHAMWQIAMDGSRKLPQRILDTIADNLQAGRPCPGLTLAVAAWMKYVSGRDEAGAAIDVRDPLADPLRGLWQNSPETGARVDAYLAHRAVFGALSDHAGFRAALIRACDDLETLGARGAVERITR
ncbi:mannitol dehydrogenase family protein [Actibacterium sp. MT2.3-13A]|uniref:mannitol dehydrogenase family protein n=1 Tax=Actibacterium sp. MT2.3-13A TaxID=2828332 RepID=UPI0020136EB1|nr:mannitol dehydrogenase family protein [Actibacterium sp. MT2.3-13A]